MYAKSCETFTDLWHPYNTKVKQIICSLVSEPYAHALNAHDHKLFVLFLFLISINKSQMTQLVFRIRPINFDNTYNDITESEKGLVYEMVIECNNSFGFI